MQIHELPAQSTTNNSDELAIDTGLTTQRVNVETLGKKITEDAAPAFTSGDASDPSSWTDVTALSSGTAMKAILNKISTMFKNIRYLYKMLGTADISAIDNGTVTGAISKLNTDLASVRFTGTANSSLGASSCIGYYDKAAKVCRIHFNFMSTTNINTSFNLFTIPAQYCPSQSYGGMLLYNDANNVSGAYTCSVNTSGQIRQAAGSTIRSGIGYIEYPL